MSGTSMDGIDVALLETDGKAHVRPLKYLAIPYDKADRLYLRSAMQAALAMERPGPHPIVDAASVAVTQHHVRAVRSLLDSLPNIYPIDIAVIGFHGQTVAHRPDRGWTWQIGDGAAMARELGIAVVDDFRSADVAAGGQGAPLVPIYHRALAAGLDLPVAVLNLGGVGNISFVGPDDQLIAFDTGPGNALIDDWILAQTGHTHDAGGQIAASGTLDQAVLARLLDNPWFHLPPPKSLDRSHFAGLAGDMATADGAATLTAFTAHSVARALDHLPERPLRLLVAGGGRHNLHLMKIIRDVTGLPVEPVEAVGWAGDATEAEAFAYMAVRSLTGLPNSFPLTTGVPAPTAGGRLNLPGGKPAQRERSSRG
jgi:anhydro-N-acetylmuramic acid kinase